LIPSISDLTKILATIDSNEGFQLDKSQEKALLEASLLKEGVTTIRGGLNSGKTSLVPLIAYSMLQIKDSIEREREIKSKSVKTYTIAELMNGDDSSDEEMYDTSKNSHAVKFPWYQPNYVHLYD